MYMNRIQLLDCTLRDGGYLNDWKFGRNTKIILDSLEKANMDMIECGFLTACEYDGKHTLFPDTTYVDRLFKKAGEKLPFLVAMIAMGEKEIHPSKISDASETLVQGIRLTFHLSERKKALEWGRILMKKGYKVFMQPVGSANYSDEELLSVIRDINEMKPYAFYLVDTLGTMYQRDIKRLLYLVDNNLAEGICLGLHSHNNMQMSFANAQEMIHFPTKRTIFIDCCIYGMGRGAGNLCSELLCGYLNSLEPGRYDTLPLIESIDRCLMYFFSKCPWGYSTAYYLAASCHCHPNYATFLLAKQKLSVCEIAEILKELPEKERLIFDKERISHLYEKHQTCSVDDHKERTRLHRLLSGKRILLLGNGASLKKEQAAILQYIQENNCYVIGVNGRPKGFPVDLIFIGNEKRYQQMERKLSLKHTVFTSNIRHLPDSAHIVNYTDLVNKDADASDNVGLMLLTLLQKVGIQGAVLAGFDGYRGNPVLNYADLHLVGSVEPLEYRVKNKATALQLEKIGREMDLEFLTATKYKIPGLRRVKQHG